MPGLICPNDGSIMESDAPVRRVAEGVHEHVCTECGYLEVR